MAVCDLCKGTGRLLKPWYDTTGLMTGFTGDICFKCDGKGTIEEPLTNEEYIKSLNTEQLARILHKMTIACYCCGKDGRIDEKPSHCVFGRCTGEKDILEWLKQPYEE